MSVTLRLANEVLSPGDVTAKMRLHTRYLLAQILSSHPPEISTNRSPIRTVVAREIAFGEDFTVPFGDGYVVRMCVELTTFEQLESGDRFCAPDDRDRLQWFVSCGDRTYAPLAGAVEGSPFGTPLDPELTQPYAPESHVHRLIMCAEY